MGCDEPVEIRVARALLRLADVEWLGSQEKTAAPVKGEAKKPSKAAARKESRERSKPPGSKRDRVERATQAEVDRRIAKYQAEKDSKNVGNLSEQVTLRVLERLDYQVLGTQGDFDGAVSEIVGESTRMNAEDFIVVKDGRLATVNSKGAYTRGSTRIRTDGNLSTPGMSKTQRQGMYHEKRAGLISPLEGTPFAQAVKVDLVNKLAQVFEIGPNQRLTPVGEPISVMSDIAEVMARFPGDQDIDPPRSPEFPDEPRTDK